MGDNYSPPEDASQNQNYQQLVFEISRRISFCLHIRLRWLTQPYVLANAGGCVRRCRRVRFLSEKGSFLVAYYSVESGKKKYEKTPALTYYLPIIINFA